MEVVTAQLKRMFQVDRRAFMRGAVSLLACAAAPRLLPAWLRVDAQSGGQRSFKMLVLGDSVVWGQGLQEEAKFYSMVEKGLERQLGREVDKLNLSHSGASILPKSKPCPALPGEVPIGTPTIYTQANTALTIYAAAGVNREEVDLVLLNGGINDVGFPVIVNPFTKEKKIAEQSKKYCFREMVKLLCTLRESFPNAHLIVTGYFPIISKSTNHLLVADLIKAFLGISKGDEILRSAAKRQKEQLKRAAILHDENLMRSNWLIDKLALLSDLWKTTSDADLQAAVDAANAATNCKQTTGPASKAIFVKVNFSPDECYAASKTNLWQITGSSGSVGHLITDDQMFKERGNICRLVKSDLNSRARLICPVAGTGHPNSHGAIKYADAILQKLTTLTR